MTSDNGDRRDSPLALKLKERIRRDGPISVHDYMQACLGDPEHGYYRKQNAIGGAGDFVTAPEISQIFGELIGLWCAVVWQSMGSPAAFHLIELGPGRGTLMRDALRAVRVLPGFLAAARLHLVESNATLADVQRTTLQDAAAPIAWHDSIDALAALPAAQAILVANEFLDALPTEQFVMKSGHWHQRAIGLDADNRLAFTVLPSPSCSRQGSALPPGGDGGTTTRLWDGNAYSAVAASNGDSLEICPAHAEIAATLDALATRAPLAALFIDYGHTRAELGDTLQAVSRHHAVDPLAAPGETDLTTEVDFEHFAACCRTAAVGLAVDGPISQAELLGRLGIVERASRLMSLNPRDAAGIEAAVARLISPQAMGSRFKAIAVRSPAVPVLPGFDSGSSL